jgi:subtilisin family serine protease
MVIVAVILGLVLLATLAVPSRAKPAEKVERVLVRFSPGQKASLKQALQQRGGWIHHEFDELNTIAVTLPANALSGIRNNPNVVVVEQDHLRYPAEQVVPYGVDSVQARDLWDVDRDGVVDPGAPTGAGITVCIIDSGLYADHPDFSGVEILGGDPRKTWDTDNCGHGTHVAGTVAAMNNTIGVVGVSPGEVSLYIVKVFNDSCTWEYVSTLIDAAYRCRDAGARVISMSFVGKYYSSVENDAFQSLYNEGVLNVAAAGNKQFPGYAYPASYDAVISVAAVDANNTVASFSEQNDRVELAAPGVSVYSTANNGDYTHKSGTSMAAPHVAAAAALVWSADPGKTNGNVRSALQSSALDLGPGGRDNAYGFGLVQAYDAYLDLSPQPTGVDLAGLEASADGAAIRVEWETVSEVDNLGFYVQRAESADGPWTRLNEGLILSQVPPGSPEGASYQFVDGSVSPGVTHYYRLADVDVYGLVTYHGPVSTALPERSPWFLPTRSRTGPRVVGR